MYLLAHAGIKLGAAYALKKVVNCRPSGLILLPGVPANGRTFPHTLLFFLLTLPAASLIYRQKLAMWGIYIAFGVLTHFIMDAMWTDPVTFYWPLYGAFQTHAGITFAWVVQSWIKSFFEEPRL